METTDLLFSLLRHAVCDEKLNRETVEACTPDTLVAVYALANKHDLAHLVAHALEGVTIPECEALQKLRKAKTMAIFRYARMDYEYEQLCRILENAEIPFVPVKGIVTRAYYPEPWMRTSSDIDILVKETDLKRATDALMLHHWSIHGEINHHDVHMCSAGGIHLDLHHSIKGNIDSTDVVLDRVWEHCILAENKRFEYRQTNAFFLYHLFAHTSRHFLSQECGIRPFLDLWMLRQRMVWDENALQKLCEAANIETFRLRMDELSCVWFGGKKHTQITEKMARCVVEREKQTQYYSASLFQKARANQPGHWGSRLIISYDLLKTTYPILEKHRWLTPLFQAVRWLKKLTDGRIGRMIQQHRIKKSIDTTHIAEAKQFLQDIGLCD